MAQVARPVDKRRMCRIIDNACPVGAMNVVTHGAPAVRYGIIQMLPQENRLFSLMAAFAEFRYILLQQGSGRRRSMRTMAVDATLFHRVVFELVLRNSIRLILMAGKTQLVATRAQIILEIR